MIDIYVVYTLQAKLKRSYLVQGSGSTFTGVGSAPIGADFILWTDCDGLDPCEYTLIGALSTFCNSHRC